jgi:pyruvate dehydrogenase E1 component alpha subunit
VFGDGATSKGDVYEAMNLAGVWELPVVFVVSNNQWAISTPRAEQSAAATLAQKAIAAGFRGEQVDGNDVIAVAHVVNEAIAHARSGQGPRLVECLTYRLGDHTTVDDASRYRDDEEVSRAWHAEPVRRLRTFLNGRGIWSQDLEDSWLQHCEAQVAQAVDDYLKLPPRGPETLFDCLFETLPEGLIAQQQALIARGAEDGRA